MCLVTILLATGVAAADANATARRSRASAGARIRDNQRQVAHCEITCTNIADERKAVSILEVANCKHVALEVRGDSLQSVGPNGPGRNCAGVLGSRRNGRCNNGPAEEGQRAIA